MVQLSMLAKIFLKILAEQNVWPHLSASDATLDEKLCQILGTISVNNMEKSEVKMASPNHLHNVSRKPLNVQYT